VAGVTREGPFHICIVAAKRVLEFAQFLPGLPEKALVLDAARKLLDELRYFDNALTRSERP
jgi:hypothetical protein